MKNKWIESHAHIDFNGKKASICNIRCQCFIDNFKFVVFKRIKNYFDPFIKLLRENRKVSNKSKNHQNNDSLCNVSKVYKFPKLKSSFSKTKHDEEEPQKISQIEKEYSNTTSSNLLNSANLSNTFKISKKVELKNIPKQYQMPESRNTKEQIFQISQSFSELTEKEKRKVAIFGSSDNNDRNRNSSLRIINQIIGSPDQTKVGDLTALNKLKRIVTKKRSMIKYINRKYVNKSYIKKSQLNENAQK